MPALKRSVPDRLRWIGTAVARRHAASLVLGEAIAPWHDIDQPAIAAPAKAFSARLSPNRCPARAASASTTSSATRRRPSPPSPATPKTTPRRAASIQRGSVAHRSAADTPTTREGLVRARITVLVSLPAYIAKACAIAPAPYHRRRASPRGPTTRIARHARQRYRRSVTTPCSGGPPGDAGPRTCRSTSPCPTMTLRPPSGCAAAPQQGHDPGRAAAHVGTASLQDLIPSGLAMNLSELRVFSTGDAKHGGGGGPG